MWLIVEKAQKGGGGLAFYFYSSQSFIPWNFNIKSVFYDNIICT